MEIKDYYKGRKQELLQRIGLCKHKALEDIVKRLQDFLIEQATIVKDLKEMETREKTSLDKKAQEEKSKIDKNLAGGKK